MGRKTVVEKAPTKARTRRVTTEVIDPPNDPILEDAALSPELESALSQLIQTGGHVVILRKATEGGKFAWLKRVPAGEFSLDSLAELYGGGEYCIKFYDEEGQPVNSALHLIDPSVKGRLTATAPMSESSDLGGVLAIFQAQITASNLRHEQLMERILSSQPSEEKIIEKLKSLKDVIGGNNTMSPDMMFQMFKAGLDISREATDTGKSGGSIAEIGERVLSQVAENVVARFMQPTSTTTPPAKVLPAPAPANPLNPTPNGASQPPKGADDMWMIREYVKGFIPQMIHQAKRQSDPELYAALMIDNCPVAVYPKAKEYLSRPTLVDELTAINAEVGTVKAWFSDLQRNLVALLDERLTSVDEPPVALDASRPVPTTES